MANNKKQLDDLMRMINKKVNKEISRLVIKVAMANDVSVKYIEKNHSDFIEEQRAKLFEAEKEKHKDEIEKLSNANYEAPKKELVIEVVEMEEATKGNTPKKKTKSEFGFYQDEIDFMIQEYIYGNKGCKTIARIMGRDEKKVRKQIALTVSEICA